MSGVIQVIQIAMQGRCYQLGLALSAMALRTIQLRCQVFGEFGVFKVGLGRDLFKPHPKPEPCGEKRILVGALLPGVKFSSPLSKRGFF